MSGKMYEWVNRGTGEEPVLLDSECRRPIALFKAPNAENWIVILWQDHASYGQTNANDRLAI